jgi:flagellar biosynthetic protein FliR
VNPLSDFLNANVFALMVIFARVGTAFAILPGLSAPHVDARFRLAIAMGLSLLLLPILSASLPPQPESATGVFLILAGEILVGGFLGAVGQVLLAALNTAGTLIAMFSSLANAFIQDPIAEQQSSTVSSLLTTTGILLVFVTDLHHLMIVAVVDSYSLFVPGSAIPVGDVADLLAHKVDDSFALGLQLSGPFLIVAMTYYIGLGLISRLTPALQAVFFAAMPLQIMMQITVVLITFSSIMMVFLRYFQDGFTTLLAP